MKKNNIDFVFWMREKGRKIIQFAETFDLRFAKNYFYEYISLTNTG